MDVRAGIDSLINSSAVQSASDGLRRRSVIWKTVGMVVFVFRRPTMNRVLLSAVMFAVLGVAQWGAPSQVFAGDPCCGPCAPQCCPTTCCTTSYRTVVRCTPVTRYRTVRYVDACGCCRTKCCAYTAYVRTCCRVPVTTCHTVCAPVQNCATNCCATSSRPARPRLFQNLLAKCRAKRTNVCCN